MSAAVEFAFQFGQDQSDGFGGAGAVGNDIGGCGAGPAKIALGMGGVLGILVIGIGVDGRHETGDDAIFVFQSTWAMGARQLVVQEAQLMIVSVPSRILWFTLKTMVFRSPVAGAEMTTRLAPAVRWSCGFVLIGKEAGAFEDDVHIMVLPGDLGRIFLSIYFDFFTVYEMEFSVDFTSWFKPALCAVVFQQVSQDFGTGQIINRHYIYSFQTVDLAVSQTSDPAKTIDSNFNCAHSFDDLIFRMQSYETKTFGKLSQQPISLQTLNVKNGWGFTVKAALVKGLRRIPFTDESRVRFPYAVLFRLKA